MIFLQSQTQTRNSTSNRGVQDPHDLEFWPLMYYGVFDLSVLSGIDLGLNFFYFLSLDLF